MMDIMVINSNITIRDAVKSVYSTNSSKSRDELVIKIFDYMEEKSVPGWKRPCWLVSKLLSIFGYRTKKEDQIIKTMRKYKIETLCDLFTEYNSYLTTFKRDIFCSSTVQHLQQKFPQYTAKEIFLLVHHRDTCNEILEGLTSSSEQEENPQLLEKKSTLWKEIKAAIHPYEEEDKEKIVKNSLVKCSSFNSNNKLDFLRQLHDFCSTGTLSKQVETQLKSFIEDNALSIDDTALDNILKNLNTRETVRQHYQEKIGQTIDSLMSDKSTSWKDCSDSTRATYLSLKSPLIK